MGKDIFVGIIKWIVIGSLTIVISTVVASRDLKARVEKLEFQRTVEAKLLCRIALSVDALSKDKDSELNNACTSLIGI